MVAKPVFYFAGRRVLKIQSSGKTSGPNREEVNLGYYMKRNLYRSPTIVWIAKSIVTCILVRDSK
jgi:hypothetical protein